MVKQTRSQRKYGGLKGTSLDTKVRAKKKRAEKHEAKHPNDKGVVNPPSGICKCCGKTMAELRKDPTLMHFSVGELGSNLKRFKGKPVK